MRLDNYFPQNIIRILIDHNHNDLGKVLTPEHVNRMAERVKKNVGQSIIKHTRKQVTELIEHATEMAEEEMKGIVRKASDNMRVKQTAELERLQSLAKVNPSIRQEEIDYLEATATRVDEFMQHAQLKLDAVRVAISRR